MWPKAFTQLVELAPHISRLLPMADRFFQSKTAAEDAQRRTLDTLGSSLDARLGEFTTANRQQLAQLAALGAEHTAQLNALREALDRSAADARAARSAAEAVETRGARQARLWPLMILICALLAAVLVLLIVVVAHLR